MFDFHTSVSCPRETEESPPTLRLHVVDLDPTLSELPTRHSSSWMDGCEVGRGDLNNNHNARLRVGVDLLSSHGRVIRSRPKAYSSHLRVESRSTIIPDELPHPTTLRSYKSVHAWRSQQASDHQIPPDQTRTGHDSSHDRLCLDYDKRDHSSQVASASALLQRTNMNLHETHHKDHQ